MPSERREGYVCILWLATKNEVAMDWTTNLETAASSKQNTFCDVRVWQLWGKAQTVLPHHEVEWHPLLCHLLDVTACAELLLRLLYPQRLTQRAEALGLSEDDTLAWILFVVALHDLGKATPAFQSKCLPRAEALRTLGLDFPQSSEPHGSISAILIPAELARFGCSPRLARGLGAAVGAHHGDFTRTEKLNNLEDDPGKVTGRALQWHELRTAMVDVLAAVTGVVDARTPHLPTPESLRNGLFADLAGLTTVADWLGSNADIFAFSAIPDAPVSYYSEVARPRARAALREAGFRRPPKPVARTFRELFQRSPWPLHEAIGHIAKNVEPGSLVIVEAPMGEGKTEAALLLYDNLASRGAAGLYFALPTQATANQILGRIERYLARSFPGEAHGLHLVHGGAGLSHRYEELKQRAFCTRAIDGAAQGTEDQGPIADAWFARSKRALLAPLAVGTIDQALLGVLRSKHHFLRLHGLAGKVVLVDEVHAYDTYTSQILARMCQWLRAIGSTVVLLSATLASTQRARLLGAYGIDPAPLMAAYPRLTVVSDGQVRTVAFESRRKPVDVTVEWKEEANLFSALPEVLREGGCVAWIVNTVARSQAVYCALLEMRRCGELPADIELSLLHARFPFVDRQTRERHAEEAFGAPEVAKERPRAAVLVGTQVLEQSLDLDFDLMITDLAPIDLVLQRLGRLHRHERGARPEALSIRRVWIRLPDDADVDDGPKFAQSAYVYDESVLLRTWLALVDRLRITLPDDIEPLVEQVYTLTENNGNSAVSNRLTQLDEARKNEALRDASVAERRELPAPTLNNPFGDFSARFDEEDPRIHQELRAVTRLGAESVNVIPVVTRNGHTVLAGDTAIELPHDAMRLDFSTVVAFARQTLSISHRTICLVLLSEAPPPCFQRSGHLRHHRLLHLNDAREADIGGIRVRLDKEFGLVIGSLSLGSAESVV